MSVDAIGGGVGLEIVGLSDGPNLASLVDSSTVAVGADTQGDSGGAALAGVLDFEAAMLAAAGLCEEVLTEVIDHSLVEEESVGGAPGASDSSVPSPADLASLDLVPDFSVGLLHPALVELIQSATPQQLLQISSNLEFGAGLTLESPSAMGYSSATSTGSPDDSPLTSDAAVEGFTTENTNRTDGAFESAFGRVARVVGQESDVIPRLSPEMVASIRRDGATDGSGLQSGILANRGGHAETDYGNELSNRGDIGPSLVLAQERASSSSVPAGRVSWAANVSLGDLAQIAVDQPASLEPSIASFGQEQPSAGIGEGVNRVVKVLEIPQSTPGTSVARVMSTAIGAPVASAVVNQPDFSGFSGVSLSGSEDAIGASSAGQIMPEAAVAISESSRGKGNELSPQAVANQDGSLGTSLLQTGSREAGADLGGRDEKDFGRGGGDRRLSGEGPAQGNVPTIGWHGRKVVSESISLREPRLNIAAKEVLEPSGLLKTEGDDAEMTAFSLVQRSGVSRSVSSGDVRGMNQASSIERAAGEVWSRLADAVARVRADRGALKVEIALPRGLSVEVELRGVAGGVTAVFRVGDSGLRQTLESMWSVLPRNEKVSALELTDVSFERGASREFTDADSRGGRQDARRGSDERFDGDVQDFDRKSRKNRELGTGEATRGGRERNLTSRSMGVPPVAGRLSDVG
jgi:hypothetical protein